MDKKIRDSGGEVGIPRTMNTTNTMNVNDGKSLLPSISMLPGKDQSKSLSSHSDHGRDMISDVQMVVVTHAMPHGLCVSPA